MTDKNFKNSQSPRASRSSTQNPLEHAKGKVQLGMKMPNKSGGEGNESAWANQGKLATGQKDIKGTRLPRT
jgi:hypothetical protein